MKLKVLAIAVIAATTLLAGCGAKTQTASAPAASATPAASAAPKASATPAATPAASPAASPKVDTATSASVVDNADAFIKAIGKQGTWIIATLKDLKTDKELVLDGDFKNGKKNADGTDAIQRKIALYTQDENKKVTARFTLTAPKLTINSPEARIQSGTFKGDVYVNVKNFQLVDATVDGNVYFASEDIKASFKMDATSKITGKQEVKK